MPNKDQSYGWPEKSKFPRDNVSIACSRLDIVLVDQCGKPKGRPLLIAAIDDATREILALRIYTESGEGGN